MVFQFIIIRDYRCPPVVLLWEIHRPALISKSNLFHSLESMH